MSAEAVRRVWAGGDVRRIVADVTASGLLYLFF